MILNNIEKLEILFIIRQRGSLFAIIILMNTKIEEIEAVLQKFYQLNQIPSHLADATTYSLMAGGKRIRPILFLNMLEAFGLQLSEAHFEVAATIEMIHTGSLIHDDLPAMDNDDYRRGKLTNHKKNLTRQQQFWLEMLSF